MRLGRFAWQRARALLDRLQVAKTNSSAEFQVFLNGLQLYKSLKEKEKVKIFTVLDC